MSRTRCLIAGIALVAASSSLPAQTAERFTISGEHVAIYNLAGKITVGPGSGADVVVELTRMGPDAGQLRVETGPIRELPTFRVIFPDDQIVYRAGDWSGRTEMYVRDDGTFGGSFNNHDRGNRVEIRSSGNGLEAHANLRVLVPAGKRVAVNIGLGPIAAVNVNGNITLDASSGNISADRMRGSLLVDTGSGNVTVTTIEGELNIDTGSGDVRVTDANGPDVTIDTGSGNVTGSGVTTTDLSVDTGSGNIVLSGVRAQSINMDTGSGDVDLTLLADSDNLNVDTGSGNVTIGVPPGYGSTVTLETSSGDVETDVEIQVTRRGRQHLVGRIGDGRGQMNIETGSGNVTIRGSR
jgi:lia operon protein LiaG